MFLSVTPQNGYNNRYKKLSHFRGALGYYSHFQNNKQIMGVSAHQHRVVTGMYNSIFLKVCKNSTVDEMSASNALSVTISVV